MPTSPFSREGQAAILLTFFRSFHRCPAQPNTQILRAVNSVRILGGDLPKPHGTRYLSCRNTFAVALSVASSYGTRDQSRPTSFLSHICSCMAGYRTSRTQSSSTPPGKGMFMYYGMITIRNYKILYYILRTITAINVTTIIHGCFRDRGLSARGGDFEHLQAQGHELELF